MTALTSGFYQFIGYKLLTKLVFLYENVDYGIF